MEQNLKETLDLLFEARRMGLTVKYEKNSISLIMPSHELPDPGIIDRLRHQKPAIMDLLSRSARKGDGDAGDPGATILRLRGEYEGHFPLSYSQERLWIIDRMTGSLAYHLPAMLRLKGSVNAGWLEATLKEIVRRHEALRTVIRESGDSVCQQLLPPEGFSMALHLEPLPGTAADAIVNDFIHAPFDLAKDFMLRALLVKQGNEAYVLVLVTHHIASDAASVSLLLTEFISIYNAYAAGQPHGLQVPPFQHTDYALLQRQLLTPARLYEGMDFWKSYLEGMTPLELPFDGIRPSAVNEEGKRVQFRINDGLYRRVREYAHEEGATLFMALLAIFKVLLYRYTSHQDIAVGVPVSGRGHHSFQSTVGFLVNTIVTRDKVTANAGFRELLQSVKTSVSKCFTYRDIPFERLLDDPAIPRQEGRNPLFQVMFSVNQFAEHAEDSMNGLQFRVEMPEKVHSKFDLSFEFTPSAEGLQLAIEYPVAAFSTGAIQRMAQHYSEVLRTCLEDPLLPVNSIDLMTPAERQAVLYDLNATDHPWEQDKTMVDLFTEQMNKAPDRIVLVAGDKQFTHAEVYAASSRIARRLRNTYGVEKNVRVGVMLPRNEQLIFSIWGILQAGGAYVPMDPELPAERLAYIKAESGAAVIIDEQWLEGLGTDGNTDLQIAPVGPTPDSMMYVMFTSGSTGKPKGVVIHHRGIVNRIEWMWHQYGYSSSDTILQKTNFAFDVSVWEIFMPFCFGAKLVLCTRAESASPFHLIRLIQRNGVTCCHFVPSMLDVFIQYLDDHRQDIAQLKSLRLVITSGEALLPESVRRWYRKLSVPLHNLYGPTEASVDVTYFATAPDNMRVPIGKPIWNMYIYILNEADIPQPIGIAGEICIGGPGLASGYINRPDLTAEKFVADPFREHGRLYRTGDIGRWLPDGNVEYLGRKDDQVKIRGYRIELSEIETTLLSHPSVTAAVAAVVEGRTGEKELIAYLVSPSPLEVSDLQRHISASLPAYMIPSSFVQVSHIPVNANGKADRKQLIGMQVAPLRNGGVYTDAAGPIETRLLAIWRGILGDRVIGVTDNFFEVGGNSLKLIKMVSQVNKEFAASLDVMAAFRYPNIRAMAELIQKDPAVPAEPAASDGDGDALAVMEQTLNFLNLPIYEQ